MICIFLYIIAYKHIYCIFHLCILCIFSAYLVLHILAYFEMLISASWCILCIYMHILSLLAYVSFTFHSGTVWSKLVLWGFVEDSEPDSRFPGIGIRTWSLIGGLALTAGDWSSVSVLVDCRYLRLACRVVYLVPSVLLFIAEHGLQSSWGHTPDPSFHTTCSTLTSSWNLDNQYWEHTTGCEAGYDEAPA